VQNKKPNNPLFLFRLRARVLSLSRSLSLYCSPVHPCASAGWRQRTDRHPNHDCHTRAILRFFSEKRTAWYDGKPRRWLRSVPLDSLLPIRDCTKWSKKNKDRGLCSLRPKHKLDVGTKKYDGRSLRCSVLYQSAAAKRVFACVRRKKKGSNPLDLCLISARMWKLGELGFHGHHARKSFLPVLPVLLCAIFR
jgi:hypothetical protein